MKLMRLTNHRQAFTLIELLVVIAIIAILAAILFPVFAQAREKARQTSCLSNEKQLGLALMQYTQDYDEAMPGKLPSWWAPGSGWAAQLYPYVKSTSLYLCPDGTTKTTFYIDEYYALNYAMNAAFTAMPGSSSSTVAHLSSFNAPANTVMLYEVVNSNATITDTARDNDSCDGFGGIGESLHYGTDGSLNNGHCWADTGYLGSPAVSSDPFSGRASSYHQTGRHTGGSNFLLADGHSKFLLPGKVSPGNNALNSTDAQGANSVAWFGKNIPTAAGTGVSTFAATFSMN